MKTTLLTEVTVVESLLKGYPLGLLYFVKSAAAEAKGVSNCPLCAIATRRTRAKSIRMLDPRPFAVRAAILL